MFIHITDSETGSNKGSCGALVQYLEKENLNTNEMNRKETEYWFSSALSENRMQIPPQEVRVKIDGNIAKLSRTDAKFFLINISPSEKEILWLKEKFGEKEAEEKLKQFAIKVMDAYATNFKRAGIESNKDLLWYGKLEHYRYYKYDEQEVKDGLAKQGDRKSGEQMHIQVIVSRKDITNTIKLSPMNNSRGKNAEHSIKLGQFDRKAFKESGEAVFDQLFGYQREIKETMAYTNTMKNGSAEEKIKLHQLAYSLGHAVFSWEDPKLPGAVKEVLDSTPHIQPLMDLIGNAGLLASLISDHSAFNEQENDLVPDGKKKKKRRRRM